MILIWDNGESYSDHRIYFVDMGDISKECAEERVAWVRRNCVRGYHRDSEAVAIVEAAIWWKGELMKWNEFVETWVDATLSHDYGCPKLSAAIQQTSYYNKMTYEEYSKIICSCGTSEKYIDTKYIDVEKY